MRDIQIGFGRLVLILVGCGLQLGVMMGVLGCGRYGLDGRCGSGFILMLEGMMLFIPWRGVRLKKLGFFVLLLAIRFIYLSLLYGVIRRQTLQRRHVRRDFTRRGRIEVTLPASNGPEGKLTRLC
jgi:hypothetical protein